MDEANLPVLDDIFKTFIDDMPSVNLKKQGQDQNWDFSSLSSGLAYQKILQSKDVDMLPTNFEYDFLIKENSNTIRFYKRTGKRIYEIGMQRPHPLNSAYNVISKYDAPKLITYAPLRYKDDLTNRSTIYFTLPGTEIPQIVNKRLPVTADSIRIKIQEVADFRVDAWGTLTLYYDRFEVLRQEVSTRITKTLEIHSAGKWSKINNNILDPAGDLLGTSSEKFYLFLSDEAKNPIAKIIINEAGDPVIAEITAPEELNKIVSNDLTSQEIVLSPNPTYGEVKLELMNLDYGEYDFVISNVIGKKEWGEKIVIDRKLNSFKYNFSFLGKGTYFWALLDAKGQRIITKRLVIITP